MVILFGEKIINSWDDEEPKEDFKVRMSSYKKKLAELKKDMLDEILSDEETSKVEKLEAISENELLPIYIYIQHPFSKYYDQFKEKIWSNPEFDKKYGGFSRNGRKNDPIIDDIFHMGYFERRETVDLSRIARDYSEDYVKNDEITILTNRSTRDVFKITKEEFIDCIYDWCIEHKYIGFIMDW